MLKWPGSIMEHVVAHHAVTMIVLCRRRVNDYKSLVTSQNATASLA